MKNKKDRHIHKHAYAFLFSKKEFVEYLIKSFVSEELYCELNFMRFKAYMEKSYLTEGFREYESDMVIRVGWKDTDIYFYFLMEFQSTKEEYMVLRFLNYWILFHLDNSIDHKKKKIKNGKLPPTFPILIYNGKENWSAPNQLKDIIYKTSDLVSEYTPDFKYYPVIINTFSKRNLVKINNAVSAIFLFENLLSKKELEANFQVVIDIVKHETPDIAKYLSVWLTHMLQNQRIDNKIYNEIKKVTHKEAYNMLAENIKVWRKEYQEEGRAEGKAQGRAEGRAEGRADDVIKILNHKYGRVDQELKQKIVTITDDANFDKLIDLALDSSNIKEIEQFLFKI